MSLKTAGLSVSSFTALLISTGALADDPPMRVGRISYLEGTVSFHPADDDNWSYATLNYPVVSGNSFWTEPDGRSEVQIGSVEVRMDHSTEMNVSQLDDSTTRLEVPQGVVNIHFSTPPLSGSVEVMTPAGPVSLNHPGTYHIDSGQPGAAPHVEITPLEGELDVRGVDGQTEIVAGETAVLNGNPPAFSLQEGNATPFDNWALARERREEAHATAQFVSPHVTGYEDLDAYGQWSPDPTYGNVWYPTAVQADWAPYRYGHWAYVAPWGWTWVDSAPWGFAPFHYGRWAEVSGRWGWVPGEVVEHPVYAPALVAFVGGAGWSVSLSLGGATPAVGWVPLAPREVFHPYYPVSVNYTRNVNIANINRTEINNITVNNIHNVNVTNYVNQSGATVVPSNTFTQGQPVHKSVMPVTHDQLVHAPVTPTLAHLAPDNSARAEGRPLPHGGAPAPGMQSETHRPAENPQAAHMPMTGTPVQQPHAPEAPRAPEAPHIAHAVPQAAQSHEGIAPGPQHGGQASQQPQQAHEQAREPGHAPGPQAHPPMPQRTQASSNPARPETLPVHAQQVQHPQQHTHMTPTPQGWQRTPGPREGQPHPEVPHPQSQGHPQPGQDHHGNEPH